MSRIGKRPMVIPTGTDVKVESGVLSVKGPQGELSKPIHSLVDITVAEGEVAVAARNNSRLARALWGTFASHVRNMVDGVNTNFKKTLILDGIGYRVELAGNTLKLLVGYSHPVEMEVPEGLTVEVVKNTIAISGADKEKVGQFAAVVRAKKKPEPYKGKGLRYSDEIIRRKQGKKAV
jgi:large subunit ribosomal protein L6